MSSSPSSSDLLRVSSFLGDAPKSELVAFLAQCGEQHAGDLPAVRKAAVFYGLSQPNRAAAALAAHTRGQDPPLGVVRSDAEREILGDMQVGPWQRMPPGLSSSILSSSHEGRYDRFRRP